MKQPQTAVCVRACNDSDWTAAGHLTRAGPIRISFPGTAPGKVGRSEDQEADAVSCHAPGRAERRKEEGAGLGFRAPVPILPCVTDAGGTS